MYIDDITIRRIRTTQILIDDGWQFIDNGYDVIEQAINEGIKQTFYFDTKKKFLEWIDEESKNLLG